MGLGLCLAAPMLALASSASAQLRINEIRIDQPGADVDEYVEIAGPPGLVLNNIFYIVIGDAPGAIPPAQNGSIETVINLSGAVIPADGVLLVAKNTFTLGVPDLVATFTFEELDNVTHLLVTGFSGANGQDLDTNDDGILDVTPWLSEVDSVALVINPSPNGVTSDFFYSSTVVGPDGAFSPSHVWRCTDTLEWTLGTFTISAADTPGLPNPECAEGPDVIINEIRIEQPGPDTDEYFELRGPAGTLLNGLTYVVIGDPTDGATNTNSGVIEAVIPLTGLAIPADGIFLCAEDDNTLGAIADLFVELNFEGSDNVTHLLVAGFSGSLGDDLDSNDDGVLDVTPWSAVVDSVALVENTTLPPAAGNEHWYSATVVGPEGSFVPGHIYRCVPTSEWQIGNFDPALGVDTPGTANSECILCGIPGSGSCFEIHGPGCVDAACCNAVCAVDFACCEITWDADCVDQATDLCLAGGTPPAVLLSEIRIDQVGTDNDEWFELVGPPNTSLAGVSYIVIGDGAGGSGVIEAVVDLGSLLIPASGYLVVAESTFTLGTPDLIANLNFENGDTVTHLLVFNFIGSNGQDLDIDDDGVLDSTPWSVIIDGVVLLDDAIPPAGEFGYYSTVLGPDGSFPPSHVYRCTPDGSWQIGDFDTLTPDSPGLPNASCEIVVVCGNPASEDCFTVQVTPGCSDGGCCEQVCDTLPECCDIAWDVECVESAEALCLVGGEPPVVLLNEIRIDQPGTDNDEYAELAAAPGTSLDGVFYLVIGDGAAALGSGVVEAVIDLSGQTITDGLFVIAESTLTLGVADLVLGATGLNFENGDNVTHMLVFNFTGANGQDLDANDDGVLDVTPWQSIIDSVALIGPNYPPAGPGQEHVYSATIVGPEVTETGTFVPAHVYRCDSAWLIGLFDPALSVDTVNAPNPCPAPRCPEDLNDDGQVDGADLGILLSQWGVGGSADLDGSGVVDGADLGTLLAAWGPC
jgi:hypothetical protein